MNLTEEARRLLTCEELRGRVPQEVHEFLRVVAGLEPAAYVARVRFGDPVIFEMGNTPPLKRGENLYTLDCVATTGCKVTTEKTEPRHDQP